MKKLKIFLLILLVFSVFIPKTHAETIASSNFLIDANTYDLNGNYVSQWENAQQVNTPSTGGFPIVYGFQINQLNFSKECNNSYTYRVDYTFWGWHNENLGNLWVDYAKSIYVNGNNITTIGTVIQLISGYEVKFSTFFTWNPTYCPIDSINSLNFRVNDYLRKPVDFNYFYNYIHAAEGPYYYVYNATFEGISAAAATQLVNEYYESGSVTQQKLDNLSGQLVNVNTKLEETNKKLDELYQNVNQTNDKLDDLNDNITNSDTTSSQNTANGFFNNFNTQDNGGISAIVTAPLRAINSMVDGTCQPLTATWRGKTISLPCGTEFWNKMSSVRTFLNVIEGGIICYGILVDLYKMINRMKDPEDDRVDVMKL